MDIVCNVCLLIIYLHSKLKCDQNFTEIFLFIIFYNITRHISSKILFLLSI